VGRLAMRPSVRSLDLAIGGNPTHDDRDIGLDTGENRLECLGRLFLSGKSLHSENSRKHTVPSIERQSARIGKCFLNRK
jgi:hypothetical protein